MKAKYILLIGLFAATMVACSRDEESLFDTPAALRAQEAIDNANEVLTSQEAWEMAYFPNLEADAKGYNMVLKFKKNGNVSVTAKNSTTTTNKIMTDTASTWAVKSDYGPLLTFDTYNDVFHAWADPDPDGAGLLGDYEFLILKATPELVLLKGKKHSAYSILRPLKNPDLTTYFAACEKQQSRLFGNNNIVTVTKPNGEKMYLYDGVSGQFKSAEYGGKLVDAAATTHPVCATEDGIIVSTGFGDDVHEHIFKYDGDKGELVGESGSVINAGNLNILYGAYFTDNVKGWTVDTEGIDSIAEFLETVNTLVQDNKKNANIKMLGYGYKQSLNMYEGGHFILMQFGYKQGGKGKEQVIKLVWTVDIAANENGITVTNLQPYDATPDDGKPGITETWLKNIPMIQSIVDELLGTFVATPSPANLINAAAGMQLEGDNTLSIMGSTKVTM